MKIISKFRVSVLMYMISLIMLGVMFVCCFSGSIIADEAFSLTIGLWSVRPGTLVLYAKLAAGIAKLPRLVASAIVRKHTFHSDAVRGIPGNGKP